MISSKPNLIQIYLRDADSYLPQSPPPPPYTDKSPSLNVDPRPLKSGALYPAVSHTSRHTSITRTPPTQFHCLELDPFVVVDARVHSV